MGVTPMHSRAFGLTVREHIQLARFTPQVGRPCRRGRAAAVDARRRRRMAHASLPGHALSLVAVLGPILMEGCMAVGPPCVLQEVARLLSAMAAMRAANPSYRPCQ